MLFIKECFNCHRKYMSHKWRQLHFVGFFDFCKGEFLEMRMCTCGTQIAVVHQTSPYDAALLQGALLQGLASKANKGKHVDSKFPDEMEE